MTRLLRLAVTLALLAPAAADAQDAKAAIDAAATALGATSLKTIEYSGWGSDYIFAQAYDGNSPWPQFYLPMYAIAIDYSVPAMKDDRRRVQGQHAPLGGAYQPLLGEQRQVWMLSGKYAWNVAGERATPGGAERDTRPALDGRTAQVWLTPHGFIKAAMAAGHATATAETVRASKKTIVSFTTATGVKLSGTINDKNLVERVETWLDNPFLGDVMFEAVFMDYKDFGGVKFPTHILQREAGYPVLDVTINDVKPNAPVNIVVPENIAQARPAAGAPAEPMKVSDGIWHYGGGSVVIEMRDHVIVVEASTNEDRSVATLDWIRKTIPGKPVRYLINTHSHFDHAGGIRTFAAEGIPIITWAGNIPYYDEVFALPHTIKPDRFAKAGKKAAFEGVIGTRTLNDGSRSVVIYHHQGSMHNPGMLMVFLPKEKILIEADMFYGMTNSPTEDVGAGYANFVQWYDVVQRLKLDVETIVPIHGHPLTNMDEARQALDAYKDTQVGDRPVEWR